MVGSFQLPESSVLNHINRNIWEKYINLHFTVPMLLQMCAKKVALSPKSMITLMNSYAEGSSIHGMKQIHNLNVLKIKVIWIYIYQSRQRYLWSVLFLWNEGVQYLSNRPFATRLLWFILVLLALAGATIFAWNVFSDWQDERTITSLKTISKPVDQLDFPSVTICKGGQNLQAVREVLEGEVEEFFLPGPISFEFFY